MGKVGRYVDGIGKMYRTTVTVINHPPSYSGYPFKVLVSETPLFSEERERGSKKRFQGVGEVEGVSHGKDSISTTRCSSSYATKHYKIQVTLQ